MKRFLLIMTAVVMLAGLCPAFAFAEDVQTVPVLTEALDYSVPDNWAYFADGEDKPVDVFFICPTVDTRSYSNSVDLNEKLKGKFVSAIDAEKGIYSDSCRFYSPYYRQMSINAYALSEEDFMQARDNAYLDISAAFRYYLDNENGGRPIVLAGFSQGAQMSIELMKEYFGNTEEGNYLHSQLVCVFAIGWHISDDDIKDYPQIVPASGETDTGSVICYECEDGTVTGSIIIPEGMKTHSINPLNWKTDSTPADASLNKGALFSEEEGIIPGFCGAYIDKNRGSLIVTGINGADYPKVLDIFPDGCYHIYDNMFFYTNLKDNLNLRVQTYLRAQETENQAVDGAIPPKTGDTDGITIAIAATAVGAILLIGKTAGLMNRRRK